MSEGLVLRSDYDDVGTCDCCFTENVGRHLFEEDPLMKKSARFLCYVCASTFVGNYFQQRAYADIFPIAQIVAQVGNIILKRISNISMEKL